MFYDMPNIWLALNNKVQRKEVVIIRIKIFQEINQPFFTIQYIQHFDYILNEGVY